jgi:uncharacterized protein (DUF4415 family)
MGTSKNNTLRVDSGVYTIMMKYLILSMENHAVYTMVMSPVIANALVSGDGDTVIRGITTATSPEYTRPLNRDWFQGTYWQVGSDNRFTEIDPTKITDKWRAQQQVMRLRQDLLFAWQSHLEASLSRVVRHTWQHFDVLAEAEFSRCDPAQGQYSWIIEEYARIIEQPVEQAYKELKLRIESDNMVRFRIQAMGEKWKARINAVTEVSQSDQVRKEMAREFWLNSVI